VSKKLGDLLEKCRVRKKGSLGSAAKAYFQATKNKRELDQLQEELKSSSGRLRTAMITMTL
jgi:hypothetical protein